jgi:O-antigen ligase
VRTERLLTGASIALLVLAILLGGASGIRAGAAANGALQIIAVVLLVGAIWTARGTTLPAGARPLLWIAGLFIVYTLLTLVPLPATVWGALPGRGPIVHGYELLGMAPPALPAAMQPQNSLASLLWLLPPAAMFLLVVQLPTERRRVLLLVLVVMAGVSIGLGITQLLGGPGSDLRFYSITNVSLPVGFFANANHLATLLLCALPAAGFFAARAVSSSRRRARQFSGVAVAGALGAFLVLGIAIIGSTAGYGLVLPAAFSALLIYRRVAQGRIGGRWLAAVGLVFLLFLGFAVAGPLSQEALSDDLSNAPTSRNTLTATTAEGVRRTFPAGIGLGAFADYYRTLERPNPEVSEYANHAHNDYVEIALELGLAGLLLLLGFLYWWGRRAIAAWNSDTSGASAARAGSVIVLIVLLHSIVDYPIRTSAIAVVFAMACALLLSPASRSAAAGSAESGKRSGGSARHIEAD